MAGATPNYGFILPVGTEDYDVEVFNTNMQSLDTIIKSLADTFSSFIKFTAEGGVAYKMINKTGSASVKGSIVTVNSALADSVKLQVNEFDAIGVMYEDGIADGQYCWVVKNGKADVLLKDGTASTIGNWVISADTDGRADASQPTPTPNNTTGEHTTHFKEIGHCLETKGAGTDVLARITLHFN